VTDAVCTVARVSDDPKSGREASIALLFVVASVVLTWPLAWSPGEVHSLRGDYFINIWNFWWMGSSVLEQGVSPFWTDALYFPSGISLARHTLSPLNSLVGTLLAGSVGPHDAFRLLLLVHFALSGWFFYLFARRMTGNAAGAVIAGLLWAHNPYHAYYMGQMNVSTLEFLPLAGFFMVGAWRDGSWRNVLGVAVSAGLIAATSSYYLVYAALLGGLVLVGGRWSFPDTPWLTGARRLMLAGIAAGAVVAAVSWPLLSAMLEQAPAANVAASSAEAGRLVLRSNDLLGFSWVGPPERLVVSWPTMFSYSALLLLVAGWGALRAYKAWLIAVGVFFLLGLGPVLKIGGRETDIALPYAVLADLPIFAMLRKPDRFFVLMEMFFALLVAAAWANVSARVASPRVRGLLWTLVVAGVSAEFCLAPVETYRLPESPVLEVLARSTETRSLIDLPPFGGSPLDARTNHDQTIHGKKIPGGYVTNLAQTAEHRKNSAEWKRADEALDRGDGAPMARKAADQGIDLVVLHKTVPRRRTAGAIDGTVEWRPFLFARDELLSVRQRGHLEVLPVPRSQLQTRRKALTEVFGAPTHEDDLVVVFAHR
jgi:hypothetical protein